MTEPKTLSIEVKIANYLKEHPELPDFLIDFLKNAKKLDGNPISYTTVIAYIGRITRNYLNWTLEEFKDEDKVIENIKDLNPNLMRDVAIAVNSLLKHFNIQNSKLQSLYKKQDTIYKNELKETQKIIQESNPLIDKAKAIENDNNNKLIILLYLYYPLRSDWWLVKYNEPESNFNYNIETGEVFITKRVKNNSESKFVVNDYIRDLIKENIKDDTEGYIIKYSYKRSSNGAITKYMNKITKKYLNQALSINAFRKIKVKQNETNIKSQNETEKYESRTNLAKTMGHSVGVQQEHYKERKETFEEILSQSKDNIVFYNGKKYELKEIPN